jgi:hypothetical protein
MSWMYIILSKYYPEQLLTTIISIPKLSNEEK